MLCSIHNLSAHLYWQTPKDLVYLYTWHLDETPHTGYGLVSHLSLKKLIYLHLWIFFLFIIFLFLQAIPLQFQSWVAKSVKAVADYGIFARVCTKPFLDLRLCKWRANRHVSINMRHCHYSKSNWVRLFEENVKITIPMIGTFAFSFFSEFSLQHLLLVFALFSVSGQKRNTTPVRQESYK